MGTSGLFVPAMAAVLVLGFLAGTATGILAPRLQLAVFGLIGLVFGVMLGVPCGAALSGRPNGLALSDAVQVFLRLLTVAGAAAALGAASWRIFRLKEALDLHSEWGTLGQGLGGWRISPAAGLLLAGLLLAAFALMATPPASPPACPPATPAGKPDTSAKTAT